MRSTSFFSAIVAAGIAVFAASIAWGGGANIVPAIQAADAYVPSPAAEMPADNRHTYRTVFEATRGGDKPDKMVTALLMAGDELNTLHAHGIERKNVDFVVIVHTTAADDGLLLNASYRKKYGVDNPNLKLLAELKQAGVRTYVCAQQLIADKVSPDTLSPDVAVVDDALVSIMMLEGQGYTHLTF